MGESHVLLIRATQKQRSIVYFLSDPLDTEVRETRDQDDIPSSCAPRHEETLQPIPATTPIHCVREGEKARVGRETQSVIRFDC